MIKIAVTGTGYVGLVTGVCLADLGHQVTCVDKDLTKIKTLSGGTPTIYEDGLAELLEANLAAGRINFTTDLASAMSDGTEAVFVAVGTPPKPAAAGEIAEPDLSQVEAAAAEIAQHLSNYTVVINKSTVPVGTAELVRSAIQCKNANAEFDVVSNPEFLREGKAVSDFMNPDRIVVGVTDERAADIMRAIYKPLTDRMKNNRAAYQQTTPPSAELIKYAANAMLATRIAFINEVADICEQVGADVTAVAEGIGSDARIGPAFLQAGPGFGGSCFPKDSQAFVATAQRVGTPSRIVEAVFRANTARVQTMLDKITGALGGTVAGQRVAVLGLTFKAGTDDIRESISLPLIRDLQQAGADVIAYDPQGMAHAKATLEGLECADNAEGALESANLAVIVTEWPEFKDLDWTTAASTMASARVVDLRNLLDPKTMTDAGFEYTDVGRTTGIAPAPNTPTKAAATG